MYISRWCQVTVARFEPQADPRLADARIEPREPQQLLPARETASAGRVGSFCSALLVRGEHSHRIELANSTVDTNRRPRRP
jgi:hypothetical protein